MHPEAWERLARAPLYLDQTDTRLEIERAEVEQFYAPLAERLLAGISPERRKIAVVAGPPGSGKTAFAALLAAAANATAAEETAVLVGLDGWHFPNSYLDSHTIERDGARKPMRRIKGAPETYDLEAAYACLERAPAQDQLAFPVYSRQAHDPIPAGGRIEPWHRLVILEGNYWLLDEMPWRRFQPLFDLRVFLSASRETLVEGLRERHLRGEKTPEATEQHIRTVDLPNIDRVLNGSLPAEVVVHKADSRRIGRIEA